MSGKVTIEYDACVVVEVEGDRLSDLNCFGWLRTLSIPIIYGNVRNGVVGFF